MRRGFTLAELLIALAILGVIATFSIPKVLQSQQDGKFKAIGKEAASMISGAFEAAKQRGSISSATTPLDLTPYINYVKLDSTTEVDDHQGSGKLPCSGAICLKLHNGAMLYTYNISFAGTASTNAIYFYLDPDGKETTAGSTTGPGKAVVFFLYYNARLVTYGTADAGTTSSFGVHGNCAGCDPLWFGWD